jgi:DNA modification methylase
MDLIVHSLFERFLPRLTEEELERLEGSMVEEGCREPIIVWEEENSIVDGHNRYRLCKKHDLDFEVIYKSFSDETAVLEWMAINQLGRRNLSAEWYAYMMAGGWKTAREEVKKLKEARKADVASVGLFQGQKVVPADANLKLGDVDKKIAQDNNVSTITLRNHAKYREAVDTIKDTLGEDYREKLLDKDINLSRSDIIEIGDMTPEKIKTVVDKVEKGEAKNLREAKRQIQKEIAASIEEVQPTEPSILVESGQWWKLGKHLLYCGDTSEPEFYNSLPSVPFAFADPPYNVGVDTWDHDFIWNHNWLTDVADIVCVTPGTRGDEDFSYQNRLSENPMPFRWLIACWITNGMKHGDLGYSNWINVRVYAKGKIYKNTQDICRATINNAETEETSHRGRKPTELLVWLLETFTEPEETVIDPFLGSGTTLLTAERTGRKCIGGEKEPLYCVEIISRWESMTGQQAELVGSVNAALQTA